MSQQCRNIDPTALVSSKAELGERMRIGPYAIIEDNVSIGDGTIIEPHAIIKSYTHIGIDNHIYPGVILGGEPQDIKFHGEPTSLIIGDNNVIREYVTIHRASGEGNQTTIGNRNMLMTYMHIGHNCSIGNDTQIASYTGICGHASIEDYAVIGGSVGIHQFTTIGKLSMIGGCSKVVQDIPPYMMADGRPAEITGLNLVGLRRDGIPPRVRPHLATAYKLLYRSGLNTSQALKRMRDEIEPSEAVGHLIHFIDRISNGHLGRQLE